MKSRKKPKVSGKEWKWTHNNPKDMVHSKGSPEKKIHSNTGLSTEHRKILNKQLNPTSKRTWGTTTKKVPSK